MIPGGVAILDFGSQYSQLIARRVRELGVYCELFRGDAPLSDIMSVSPGAIIMSGGPSSAYDRGAPMPAEGVLDLEIPILGICYGMQILTLAGGGSVGGGGRREYGPAAIRPVSGSVLMDGVGYGEQAWMSHGDRVEEMPKGYFPVASTDAIAVAAMENASSQRFAVQFHPEVEHTHFGRVLLENFLFGICGLERKWKMSSFASEAVGRIREQVGSEGGVILGLSGGVDSSVVAALLHRALPDRFVPIFVDTGLLRLGEREMVERTFGDHFGMHLVVMDARVRFLRELEDVEDPEQKRKTIGRLFIEVFEDAAGKLPGITHLAQGTLYPDVIESMSYKGPSATIKSHHNVGGLPERMNLKLLEPLRELFKDEVRQLGIELGLPEELVWRHPFPGPGLAVRILGPVGREDLDLLRRVDRIFTDFLREKDLYMDVWQAFAVLLPVRAVGVMGDNRTYERVVALRAVTSSDGMTADWYRMDPVLLAEVSARIVNHVAGVNRVVYDVSSKPPGTIEWE
ncbi:glutamine-hydrolyzing GMP synthase [Candidatus Fermentibacterales bacterium]|nr:glutamine-hydrolyzing GMP synthase [Candidatus Fermentibacterales bacterium]